MSRLIPKPKRDMILWQAGYLCHFCNGPLRRDGVRYQPDSACVNHMIPPCCGSDTKSIYSSLNQVASCYGCSLIKNGLNTINMPIDEIRREINNRRREKGWQYNADWASPITQRGMSSGSRLVRDEPRPIHNEVIQSDHIVSDEEFQRIANQIRAENGLPALPGSEAAIADDVDSDEAAHAEYVKQVMAQLDADKGSK